VAATPKVLQRFGDLDVRPDRRGPVPGVSVNLADHGRSGRETDDPRLEVVPVHPFRRRIFPEDLLHEKHIDRVMGSGLSFLIMPDLDRLLQLYLNNGTATPWAGVTGVNITADSHDTRDVMLGDVDGDGDLDLVVGNNGPQKNRLYLNNGTATPWAGVSGVDVTFDADNTLSVALGDVDRDGGLDLVAGNATEMDRVYLNNGTATPWAGITGADITADAHATWAMALGDVDGDGDRDLVVGNDGQANRLYLNNGTEAPWAGVSGVDVTADADLTRSVDLGDADRDGDLDLVAGNSGQANRLYLNNGTAAPWAGVSGVDVTADADSTRSVALGDLDGDGDLDLVAGNYGPRNRLYLNDGVGNPWDTLSTGVDVTLDANFTLSVVLGDVDGDGDLDLVAANDTQTNRLYLNDGAGDPWNTLSTGVDITADADSTQSIVLGDVDGDGDLDLVAGIWAQSNRLYSNNGTAAPWAGVTGTDITTDADSTGSVAFGDVDGDGDLDLVAGNRGQTNRLYDDRRVLYQTGLGRATSLRVDTETDPVVNVTLLSTTTLPPNTSVDYWLSNDGGLRWFLVRPGAFFSFPTVGTDLRWRADLRSLSPALTPRIDQIDITRGPQRAGDRVWADTDGDGIQDPGEPGMANALVALYDATGNPLDSMFTDINGNYRLGGLLRQGENLFLRFFPPSGYALTLQDQGGDDGLDSDADPFTWETPVFTLANLTDETRWDVGLIPFCAPPDEPIYIFDMTIDANSFTVLHFMDFNQPDQTTGYNVYRSSDAALPQGSWPLAASDIIDGDEATPNKQWVDTSGDVSPSGIWHYEVVAYNHRCPAATAEGPW